MIAFLFILAVSTRNEFSHLHIHVKDYFETEANLKFKSLSVKHKFPFTFEYAKLNDDAVIARNKETKEIGVFTTRQNEPLSFSSLQEYDMKLIQNVTSRCVPLHEYEFSGDFDKRTGGDGMTPDAGSYLVAMTRDTKQTFGDSINITRFQNHQSYIRWCNENPAKYQREKEVYKNSHVTWDEKTFERQIFYEYLDSPRLCRQLTNLGHEWDECILKFSKLSQDPQDLLQKSKHNGFQNMHESVELKNIEAMLLQNGYKYPENFFDYLKFDKDEAYAAKFDLKSGNVIFASPFSKIDPYAEDRLKFCLHY